MWTSHLINFRESPFLTPLLVIVFAGIVDISCIVSLSLED